MKNWQTLFVNINRRSPNAEEKVVFDALYEHFGDNDPMLVSVVATLYLAGAFRTGLLHTVDSAMQPMLLGLAEIRTLKMNFKELINSVQVQAADAYARMEPVLKGLEVLEQKIEDMENRANHAQSSLKRETYQASEAAFWYRIDLKLFCCATVLFLVTIIGGMIKTHYSETSGPWGTFPPHLQTQITVSEASGDIYHLMNCNLEGFTLDNNRCEATDPRIRKKLGSWVVVGPK